MFFECTDKYRGDRHLLSLKSLILFTSRRPGGGTPGRRQAGEPLKGGATVRWGHGRSLRGRAPRGCTSPCRRAEFTPWMLSSLEIAWTHLAIKVNIRNLFWERDLNLIFPVWACESLLFWNTVLFFRVMFLKLAFFLPQWVKFIFISVGLEGIW